MGPTINEKIGRDMNGSTGIPFKYAALMLAYILETNSLRNDSNRFISSRLPKPPFAH